METLLSLLLGVLVTAAGMILLAVIVFLEGYERRRCQHGL
jgi:hypothetical protein